MTTILASTGKGERMGCPKPSKMQSRSYKNRGWRCLCSSFAEIANKMEPGNATRSKCEPLLSVFEGSGGTHCERASAVWRERGEVESTWVPKTFENA